MRDPQDDLALGAWFDELFERDAQRDDAPAQPTETIAYGTHPDQHVDGWSVEPGQPVVVSIHGGYFKSEYDTSLHVPMVRQLVADGFGAAIVEYRRGESGRAATLADVWAALDAVVERWHPSAVAVVGHSAGGYLAEKLATHPAVDLVMPLAPVSDLAEASRKGWDDGGIAQWMGADPQDAPEEYRQADLRVGIGGAAKRVVLHGASDTAVGVEQSRSFVRALEDASVNVTYLELPGEGHYGFLDPRESAFGVMASQLRLWRESQLARQHP